LCVKRSADMTAPSPEWRLMRDRVAEFYKQQIDEGHPRGVIGDVLLAAGVYLLLETVGREVLSEHLESLAKRVLDPEFEFTREWLQ